MSFNINFHFESDTLSHTKNVPVCHLRDDIMTVLVICKNRDKRKTCWSFHSHLGGQTVLFHTTHTSRTIFFLMHKLTGNSIHAACVSSATETCVLSPSLFLCGNWKCTENMLEMHYKPLFINTPCNLDFYEATKNELLKGNTEYCKTGLISCLLVIIFKAHLGDVHTGKRPVCPWAHTDTPPSAQRAPRDLLACKNTVTSQTEYSRSL